LSIDATFVCDAVSSHRLELRKDGTFAIQEAGNSIAGTYTIDGSQLRLEPTGGQPVVSEQFDTKGFLDPHGSHWSRK
jgi:hypothetical protein